MPPRALTREIVEFAFSDLDPHLERDYRRRHSVPAGKAFRLFTALHHAVDNQNSKVTAKRVRAAVRSTFKDCEAALRTEFQRRPSEEVRRVIQTLLLTIPTIHEVVSKYTLCTSSFFSSKDLSGVLLGLEDTQITKRIYDFKTDSDGRLVLGEKIARLEQQRIGNGRAYQNYFVLDTGKVHSVILYLPKDFTLDKFVSDKQTHAIQEQIRLWGPKRFVVYREERYLIDAFLMTSNAVRWYQFFVSDPALVVVREDDRVDPESVPFQSVSVGA